MQEQQSKFSKCAKCGKIYATVEGKKYCAQCMKQRINNCKMIEESIERWNLSSPEEIARFVGLPQSEVEEIINDPEVFNKAMEKPRLCKRCHKKKAQYDSDYCLDCRLILNKELGIAAETITEKIMQEREKRLINLLDSTRSSVTSLDRNRSRIGQSVRNMTPRGRYSG